MGKKLSKEEQWRLEGMGYALRYLEMHGGSVQALRDDLTARGALRYPVPMSYEDITAFEHKVKNNTLDCVLVLVMSVLHDMNGFGRSRLQKLIKRCAVCAAMMAQDRLAWVDLQKGLREECGLDVPIRWFGVPPKQTTQDQWEEDLRDYAESLEEFEDRHMLLEFMEGNLWAKAEKAKNEKA